MADGAMPLSSCCAARAARREVDEVTLERDGKRRTQGRLSNSLMRLPFAESVSFSTAKGRLAALRACQPAPDVLRGVEVALARDIARENPADVGRDVPFVNRRMNHWPEDGRKTAVSLMPSPS